MALARKLNALTMPHPDRRPDKKERRDLLRFKHGDGGLTVTCRDDYAAT